MRRTILLSFIAALTLTACVEEAHVVSPDGKKTVTFSIEIADSAKERAKGLSGRTSIGDTQAMLFVFPKMDVYSFWMKDTKIPLDLMFFDDEGRFVSGHTMELCKESIDTCPKYKAQSQALYALEVGKGIREKNGIGVGWNLKTFWLPSAND